MQLRQQRALDTRQEPAGLEAGAPLSRMDGPAAAFALVQEELAGSEIRLRELVQSDVQAVPKVAGYLAAAGGKRLRPVLVALGARAVAFDGVVTGLMCAGELIHLGSLLHDDVVDDADRRRGQDSANRVFGNAVSVLTGDFCLARAVLLASEEGGHAAVTGLASAVTEMAEGEVLQLKRAGDLSCTFEQYRDVIERKSAALIAWCASAGALSAGNAAAVEALDTYGRGVGVAFQITDDVLDYRSGTGKTPGADLRERKVTLPLLHAMSRIPDLRDRLETRAPTADEVPDLIREIRSAGALDAAIEDAHAIANAAIGALDVLPESPARTALQVLGRYLVERTR